MAWAVPMVASTVASIVASKFVTKITGNETLGMIAGFAAGAGVGYLSSSAGSNLANNTTTTGGTETAGNAAIDSANQQTHQSIVADEMSQLPDSSTNTNTVSNNYQPDTPAPTEITTTQTYDAMDTYGDDFSYGGVSNDPVQTPAEMPDSFQKMGEDISEGYDSVKESLFGSGDSMTGEGQKLNSNISKRNALENIMTGKNGGYLEDLINPNTLVKTYLYKEMAEDMKEEENKKFDRIQWDEQRNLRPLLSTNRTRRTV